MSDDLLTLAGLQKATGIKRRRLQLWAEAGILQAEPATESHGTGVHRRFRPAEVDLAVHLAAEPHLTYRGYAERASAWRGEGTRV